MNYVLTIVNGFLFAAGFILGVAAMRLAFHLSLLGG